MRKTGEAGGGVRGPKGGTATREAIIAAIRLAGAALGRRPTAIEAWARARVSRRAVKRCFAGGWTEAVRAAGYEAYTSNLRVAERTLLEAWGRVVRKLGRVPTRDVFVRLGRFSVMNYYRRFGGWGETRGAFLAALGNEAAWADVCAIVRGAPAARCATGRSRLRSRRDRGEERLDRHRVLAGRRTFGEPLDFALMRCEPRCELGVVYLFGVLARHLGYVVESVESSFPDCEAKRRTGTGAWQQVRIEFEFESRNFHTHGHAAAGCDVIVCWRHNWPESPSGVEVLELCSVVVALGAKGAAL